MRVLILVDCYYPSLKSSAKLVHDLGAEFVASGHEVIVATPGATSGTPLQVSVEDGITVARFRFGDIKSAPRLLRAVYEMQLSPKFWRVGRTFFRENRCDLIVYYSPSIFFGSLVRKLKGLWNCPAYLILRDIFPQWAVDAGVLRKGVAYSYFRHKELELYAAADVIGVQSPASLCYFEEQWPGRYRLEVLYNWTKLREEGLPVTDYRRCLGLESKTVFFYGGNIGVAQNMDSILRLAENLHQRDDVYFLLVGEGSEVSRLNEDVAARRLRNLKILPGVSQGEYLAMVSEFDVGLISLDRRLCTHNFPGKLLGYMYWGLPILASINPGNDLQPVIERASAGLCCLDGDDRQLLEHATMLADNAEFRRRMGRNSRALLESVFSVNAAAKQILTSVERTTETTPFAASMSAGES
ncbi:MAG TPA: glycosyltransferase family 4 protein [Terriglobales bacterium]|nr:glycosyltransferase family 4 protein [Terriglobales bacterium]